MFVILKLINCAIVPLFGTADFLGASALNAASAKPFLLVDNDEKLLRDADGKGVLSPADKDSVLIADLANPEGMKILATLPLKNSVVGHPVNVDIDPTGSVALVAPSVDVVKDGDALKQNLDNKIYVIDMKANPPKLAATDGTKPSGLSFSGKMALIANRGDDPITVLSVNGTDVKVTDTIPKGDRVSQVLFTPGGKLAFIADNGNTRSSDDSVFVLRIDGNEMTKNQNIKVGRLPEAGMFAPDGRYLLAGIYLDDDSRSSRSTAPRLRIQASALKYPFTPPRPAWVTNPEDHSLSLRRLGGTSHDVEDGSSLRKRTL